MTAAPVTPTDRPLRVAQVRAEAEGVVALTLVDPHGGELPEWSPGAHVDLVLPSGLVRPYSLCGDTADRRSYTVAVLREPGGRGGSVEIHDTGLVGRVLPVRGPRNHFALRPAPAYLFLAGGIGVTPLLAMVAAAAAVGVPWTLYYGGRSRAHMAFAEHLCALGEGRVHLLPQDETGLPDLAAIVAAASADAVVYACGPEAMLRAAEQACAAAVPPRELRLERFGSAGPAPEVSGDAFEVELARTGRTVRVPADRTVLDVVREIVPGAPASCEEGFCGSCEVAVLEGMPDHRDQVLSPEEQAEGETMMICVSRCRGPRLVLDL